MPTFSNRIRSNLIKTDTLLEGGKFCVENLFYEKSFFRPKNPLIVSVAILYWRVRHVTRTPVNHDVIGLKQFSFCRGKNFNYSQKMSGLCDGSRPLYLIMKSRPGPV